MPQARKLIRDRVTKEWLTTRGFAIADPLTALDVQSFAQARRVCRDHKTRRLELVIHFGEREEVVLPMDEE